MKIVQFRLKSKKKKPCNIAEKSNNKAEVSLLQLILSDPYWLVVWFTYLDNPDKNKYW